MKVSEEIRNLVPYKPGKPISETQREYGVAQVYKLASNENALGPSPKVIKALSSALIDMHRYPDPSAHDLLQKLSQKWGYNKSHLAIGNGSNEIIDLLIRIYCEPGEGILTTECAFVAYQVCAQAARVRTYQVPLNDRMGTDVRAMVDYFLKHPEQKIRILFFPNPNNPTGTYISSTDLEYVFSHLGNRDDVLLVFDEAYNEFVRARDSKSAGEYFSRYNNIVVIRTFSKVYGMAGLRLGVMIAPSGTVDLYNRVRNPFNVNDLAQVAALAVLDDDEYISASQKLVWEGLDYFYAELKKLDLPYVESQANFVLFDTLRDVNQVNESLLKQGIILRPVLNYGLKTHLRMSVGTMTENKAAIAALKRTLSEVPQLK